jgi:SNARE associated Golgi protein
MADALVHWLQGWGELQPASAAVLALVFVVSGLIFIPRTFLCLASGAMFGLETIPIILPSTTLSAMIGFLLARYFFADWLQRQVDRQPRVRAVMDAIDDEGWRIVALLRFGSPLPSTVQTYLFGITRIGLVPFTLDAPVHRSPGLPLRLARRGRTRGAARRQLIRAQPRPDADRGSHARHRHGPGDPQGAPRPAGGGGQCPEPEARTNLPRVRLRASGSIGALET